MRFTLMAALLSATVAGAQSPAGVLIAGNKRANTASVVDLASGRTLAELPTPPGPHESAVSSDGRWGVITGYGTQQPGNTLLIIDLPVAAAVRTIDLGEYRRPHGIAFLPGDSLIAVTVEANQAVLVVHRERGVVRAIHTGEQTTHQMAVRPDGALGYTANIRSGTISEVNFATGAARSLAVAPEVEGIGVTPDGREVWVGSNTAGTISIVDVAAWKVVATLDQGERPYRVNISPDGKLAAAALTLRSRIRLIDVATRREVALMSTPDNAQPVGMTWSVDGKRLYVACQGINAIAEFDIASRRLVRTIAVGDGPDGVAVAERR
ncbi:MAG: beta-propeller fold lactonase family protein [Gemmatimonadaceae bacterium]